MATALLFAGCIAPDAGLTAPEGLSEGLDAAPMTVSAVRTRPTASLAQDWFDGSRMGLAGSWSYPTSVKSARWELRTTTNIRCRTASHGIDANGIDDYLTWDKGYARDVADSGAGGYSGSTVDHTIQVIHDLDDDGTGAYYWLWVEVTLHTANNRGISKTRRANAGIESPGYGMFCTTKYGGANDQPSTLKPGSTGGLNNPVYGAWQPTSY